MQELLSKFAEYGYFIVFFYSFGGGMLALAALGILSAQEPGISALAVIFIAFLSNLLGNLFIFYFTAQNRAVIAPKIRSHRRKIAFLVLKFRRGSFWLLLISKFLYGFKTLVPIAAQMSKMPFKRFFAQSAITCLIWAVVVFSVSKAASELIKRLIDGTSAFLLPACFIALFALLYFAVAKISKKAEKLPQKSPPPPGGEIAVTGNFSSSSEEGINCAKAAKKSAKVAKNCGENSARQNRENLHA